MGIALTAGLFARIFAEEHLVAKQYPDYVIYAAEQNGSFHSFSENVIRRRVYHQSEGVKKTHM